MPNNDGGPAFPNATDRFPDGDLRCDGSFGMSLRDYFAAKAISPLLAGAVLPSKADRDEWLPKLAEVAYELADAMMNAREVQSGK